MQSHALWNLAGLLDQHAASRPTHPALVSAAGALSYRCLARRVRQYAQGLAARGVGQGARVGVALKDHEAHVVALFAVMRLGAVIVPVDWRWSAVETAAIARHFALDAMMVEAEAPDIDGPQRITVDTAWEAALADLDGHAPLVEAPDLPMILSLSSGTTGRPTGPLLSHAQMWARTENQLVTLTFNQHDRYLLATPLYFGGGRAFALTHLMLGATLILYPPPYQPQDLVQAVARYKATSTFLVPTLLRRLMALPDAALSGLAGLRLLISSGAPLHPPERDEIERRVCAGFVEYFASTEGGGISVMAPAERDGRPDSVGRAAFRVALQVVGPDHQPLPANKVGAVRYRGPGVATGFFRDDDKSAEAFRDGWFYPGDLGRLDAEGYLTLLGRAKSVILRGGVNIYPLEIERTIGACPGVEEVSVFAVDDPDLGEEICAAVVAAPSVTEDVLRAFCQSRLAPYKQPRHYDFRDALPRNSGGKPLVLTLKADMAARLAGPGGQTP